MAQKAFDSRKKRPKIIYFRGIKKTINSTGRANIVKRKESAALKKLCYWQKSKYYNENLCIIK